MNTLEMMKPKERRKAFTAFIGPEKAEYYLKKFDKFTGEKKISINFAALIFSTYWCFYRKIFGPGAIFLLMSFGGMYITLMQPQLAAVGTLLSLIPAVVCGLFGNYFYYRYVEKSVAAAEGLSAADKEKYYHNNGGTGTRIVLGIVAAVVFFGLALLFSAGPEAIERMQQNMPAKP